MLIRAADGTTSAVIRTLMVVYQRVTGRTGPGAGRPAKLYRRRISIWPYRCPSVATIWPCGCLSSALEHAKRSGDSPRAVLDQRAYQLGQELGDTAHKAHGAATLGTPRCGDFSNTASNRASRPTTSRWLTALSTPWRRSTPNSCAG
jgi:hypothetical protein